MNYVTEDGHRVVRGQTHYCPVEGQLSRRECLCHWTEAQAELIRAAELARGSKLRDHEVWALLGIEVRR